jgi:hypothetical protein
MARRGNEARAKAAQFKMLRVPRRTPILQYRYVDGTGSSSAPVFHGANQPKSLLDFQADQPIFVAM